jgi:hypothetical protein
MNGEFEGVGIEFIILDDTIQVVAPLPGGPSEWPGILAGDKIVSINDTVIAGIKIETGKIYNKLRGPKGSKVKVGILRGRKNLRYFDVSRDVIPVKSVDAAYMLDEHTATCGWPISTAIPTRNSCSNSRRLWKKRACKAWCSTCAAIPAATSKKPPKCSASFSRRQTPGVHQRSRRTTEGLQKQWPRPF